MQVHKSQTIDLYRRLMTFLISKCESSLGHDSASRAVVNEIVNSVLGDLSDLSLQPLKRNGGIPSGVASSGEHHPLKSELNVEEVQTLLNLINNGVSLSDFGRDGDASVDEQLEETGASRGINAVVYCL